MEDQSESVSIQNQNTEVSSQNNDDTEIALIREKLARLKINNQSAENQTGTVPLIKTSDTDLLSDTKNEEQNRINVVNINPNNTQSVSSESVDVQGIADRTKKRNKYLIMFFTLVFLSVLGYSGYYFYMQSKIVEVKIVEVKKYFVYDVWPNTLKEKDLIVYTGEATSTSDIIIINVKDFEKLYAYVLKNENKFESIAKERFSYTNLGDFQDATIENIDMRISDCEEGPMVYGYIGKDKMLISNDIGKYLRVYKSLQSKAI